MPAIAARALDAWIPGSKPAITDKAAFVLVYGGDEGGVAALASDILQGAPSPLRMTADGLSPSDLRAHLSTGGLFGAPAPVRISGASDKHTTVLRKALEGLEGGPCVVVEAGVLKKQSSLKTLFDGLGATAVLHPLDPKTATAWMARAIQSSGMAMDKNALTGAENRLPSDRMRILRIAEVLALHAMGRGANSVGHEDVTAIVGNEGDVDLTQALMSALAGDTTAALVAFDGQMSAGENPIALMRAWGWKLQRFDDMVRSNARPAQAVASARPPVFFNERAISERILTRLGAPGVAFALEHMDAAERSIVHQGQPPRLVIERWLLRLSQWKP